MNRTRRRIYPQLLFIVLASLLSASVGNASEDLSASLKTEYQGKNLTLRHFYNGSRLAFSRDGSLSGSADVGPWTTDGEIQVLSIDWQDQEIKIHARRVLLAFDDKKKSLRDFLEIVKEWKSSKDREVERDLLADVVDIEIVLGLAEPPVSEVEAVMNSVFLSPSEFLINFIPDFWSEYFKRGSTPPTTVRYTEEPVYRPALGRVTAPRVIYQEGPKMSAEARRAKYQAIVMVSVVVDSKGAPRAIGILVPAGMGLDEQAIEAIGKWKFEPGRKDGRPVAVQIAVEVNFD